LKLSPILAVVTNLDREHMDCYRDMPDVEQAFLAFMDKVPFYGAVTACLDNPQLAAILPSVHRRVFTYGVAAEADFRLEFLASQPGSLSCFRVATKAAVLGPFELHVPGRHNVLNATAAVAIAHQLEVPSEKIAEGLKHFRGVDRRFQLKGKACGVTVVDDYGHHPTEIRATLAAARESSRGAFMSSFSRIGTHARAICSTNLARRLRTRTRWWSCPSTQRVRNRCPASLRNCWPNAFMGRRCNSLRIFQPPLPPWPLKLARAT